jgi:outer membrane biogenesis lipoprotein LolB
MKYKSNYKINLLLAAIVLFLLLICYLSVTRQIKADNEVQQQEQAAEQQMEEQFINMSEEHATDSIQ